MYDAAEAIRNAEIEAVQPVMSARDPKQIENMSIGELHNLAASLDVPNRGAITERDQLIAAIRERQLV